MKKILLILLLALLIVSSFGCGKKEPANSEVETETLPVEVKPGTTLVEGSLIVGINSGSSPFMSKEQDGSLNGFEVDLLGEIARLTGLKIKFVECDYEGIYAQLDIGDFDCVVSAVAINDAVDKVYDFSAAYYTDEEGNEYAILVKTGNNRLLNVLNKSIALMRHDGNMDALYEKWFKVEEESGKGDSK